MAIVISPSIRAKLATKHSVAPDEVEQCFANRNGEYLLEGRKQHAGEQPTYWFIAETHYGRKLQIAFIHEHGNIYIRTAFEPSQTAIQNYLKYGGGVI